MERKLRKTIFRNLDNIYKSAKQLGDSFETKVLPVKTVQEIITRSKPSITTESEEVNDFNRKYNKTLDSLFVMCEQRSRKSGTGKIRLSDIKEGIEAIKKGILGK